MKRIVMAAAMALLATSAFSQATKPVMIKSGKVYEKCLSLVPPQKIEYRFESAAKLNFNLHYHKGDQVYYPVKLDRTNGESGLYEAKAKETYCLMWENKSGADVELTYSAKITK
ncbi:MAG: hypothetical protein LH481_00040 [Burkholderiales bacterium]|nr:hypothetical protein [Burkholderiales bacterium]